MLVQVYGDNAMKKTADYKWVRRFSEGRESVTDEERSGRPATRRTEENIANVRQIVWWNSSADCQKHIRASEHRQRNSEENLNWRSWHEEGVYKKGPKGAHRRTKAKNSF